MIQKSRNDINYFSWFEFLYPGKAAALEAEERLNEKVIKANAENARLNADTSAMLTSMENQKLLALALIIGTFLIIYNLT